MLGTGAFATVYRGVDPRLDAPVAVKILADNWSRDIDVRQRFRAEAVLLRKAQADVPGIIDVFDIDETEDGRPFFVMTFADLGTLRERSEGRLWTHADVKPVVAALDEALGALHRADVIHRDIKPSNLLLRSDRNALAPQGDLVRAGERLMVGDLGLAKDASLEATTLSFAGGTARYMAPEQNIVGAAIDHRADIHAASVLVAELLAGADELPPAGAILEDQLPASLDPGVRSVLNRGVSTDPKDRHDSMSQWRRELTDALDGSGATSTKRRPVLIGGLVLLAVLVAAVVGFLAFRGSALDIVGPDEIEVGEIATYRIADGDPVTWTDWAGAQIDATEFEVLASLPGQLTFSALRGTDSEQLTVRVIESSNGPVINGPTSVRVGQTAVFTPTLPASTAASFWVGPDGAISEGADFRFVPTSTGTVIVSLVARDDAGVERGTRVAVTVES